MDEADFFDVFGEEVEFEVYQLAGAGLGEVGLPAGVGDDPDGEIFGSYFGDGEGDAVDGDGAFGDNVLGEIRREFDFEAVVGPDGAPVEDGRCAIDVALDEVAAEAAGGGEGALEIYQ